MLNVLYLINHAGKAGTERYVLTLAEKLGGKKINAHLAYNEEGLLVERMKELGVQTYRVEMRNRFDLGAAWKLSQLCRQLDIDIIHAQFLRENYIALLSRIFNPRVRVIYTNHFIMANNFITRLSNRVMTHLQSAIIAVCNPGRDMMVINGNDGRKIRVIHNAVDISKWSKPRNSTIRDEFQIPEDTVILLCASRFAHDKGHKFLINSLSELKKLTERDFKCILAGDGPLIDDVKKQTSELGLEKNVIFAGFRSDIENLLYGSDIYINASQHEALSFLILEALASGLPLIATNMGGNPDIINNETDCGILVEYDDHYGLAQAIVRMIEDEDLRKRLAQNAIKAVKERFNLDIASEETYNLYEEVCTNR